MTTSKTTDEQPRFATPDPNVALSTGHIHTFGECQHCGETIRKLPYLGTWEHLDGFQGCIREQVQAHQTRIAGHPYRERHYCATCGRRVVRGVSFLHACDPEDRRRFLDERSPVF